MNEVAGTCLTPGKVRYATMEAARDACKRAGFALDKKLYPYSTCPCGWIHLTSKAQQQEKLSFSEPVLLDGVEVDEDDFMLLVRAEVVGNCAPQDAERLRTPEYRLRWSDALKQFQIDIATQLNAKVGMRDEETVAWRKRLAKVQKALSERRAEAKRLGRPPSLEPRNELDMTETVCRKDLRRAAGEIALRRLKAAHDKEFLGYLIEEFKKVGLSTADMRKAYYEKEGDGDGNE